MPNYLNPFVGWYRGEKRYKFDFPKETPPGPDVLYEDVGGLRAEDVETLNRHRPETLGEANRLAGVTPAARLALLRYAKRREAS